MKKRPRKCDTEKYRRRRKAQLVSHAIHVKRRQAEEIKRHRIFRAQRERYEAEQRERRKQGQALVDILATRLYRLSPYHASKARFRQVLQIADLFGGLESHAIISYGDNGFPFFEFHQDFSVRGMRMFANVSECLLN